METQKEKEEAVRKVEKRYFAKEYYSQLRREKQILDASFAEIKKHSGQVTEIYEQAEKAYTDAQLIYGTEGLSMDERKKYLYRIYEVYFETISSLSWKKRRSIHADAYIRKMHKTVKRGREVTTIIQYWNSFARLCLLPLAVAFAGEIAFLHVWETAAPTWLVVLTLGIFIAGFGSYIILVFQLEGRRLYSNLQKWLCYKVNPEEQDKPMDSLQYIKMVIPLMIALLSALVKLYFQ